MKILCTIHILFSIRVKHICIPQLYFTVSKTHLGCYVKKRTPSKTLLPITAVKSLLMTLAGRSIKFKVHLWLGWKLNFLVHSSGVSFPYIHRENLLGGLTSLCLSMALHIAHCLVASPKKCSKNAAQRGEPGFYF